MWCNRLSLMIFQLARTMMTHNLYHNPPRWLEQLYYFVHLLSLSPLSPTPNTCLNTKHLYFPLFSLDTSLRPDRATSCPLSWASMPVRLNTFQSNCCIMFAFFLIPYLSHTKRPPITVYIFHVHK